MPKLSGDLFVASHKEFDNKHNVFTTTFGGPESFNKCKKMCVKLNKNGFNYLPYKFDQMAEKEITINITDKISPVINEMDKNNKKIIELLGRNAELTLELLNGAMNLLALERATVCGLV